jgi:hypothetical protein
MNGGSARVNDRRDRMIGSLVQARLAHDRGRRAS